jgi:DNA mismatch endonuclease Vsr
LDFLTKKQRSKLMSRIRSVSKLELRAKKQAEAAAGCRLRHGGRKSGLPGSPDWYNKSKKTVVFIHGCFWHGCDEHGSQPKTNAEFWIGACVWPNDTCPSPAMTTTPSLRKERIVVPCQLVSANLPIRLVRDGRCKASPEPKGEALM